MSALPSNNIVLHPLLAVWDTLKKRGIEAPARHEGMRPTQRIMNKARHFGVTYTCRDIHGKPTLGTDGKPLERWKRTTPSNDLDLPKDLYAVAGQKPTGSRPLMVSKDGAKPDADGTLYVVEGFADWLSMLAAGHTNTVGIFGGTGVPDDIATQTQSIDVTQIVMFVHPDDAGTHYAQSLADKTAGTEIISVFNRLPTENGNKQDVNDLWIASKFNVEAINARLSALETFTLAPTVKTEYKPRPVAAKEATPDQVKAYLTRAADGVLSDLSKVASGRNNALTAAAARFGNFIAAGWITESEAEQQLLPVALNIGLKERESLATIRSGIKTGLSTPAVLTERPIQIASSKTDTHTRARMDVQNLDHASNKDLLAKPVTEVFKRGLPFMVYAAIGLVYGAAAKVAYAILLNGAIGGLIETTFEPLAVMSEIAEEQGLEIKGQCLKRGIRTLIEVGILENQVANSKLSTVLGINTSAQFCTYGKLIALLSSNPDLKRSLMQIYGNAKYGELIKPDDLQFDGYEGAPYAPGFADELARYLPPGTETVDASTLYGKYCIALSRAYSTPPFPLAIPDDKPAWCIEKPADYDALIWRSYAATKQPDRSARWKQARLIGCTSRNTIAAARKRAGVTSTENFITIPINANSPRAIEATRAALHSDKHFPLAVNYVDEDGKERSIFAPVALKRDEVLERLKGAQKISVKAQIASTERLSISEPAPAKPKQQALPKVKQQAPVKPKQSRWAKSVNAQLALALAVIETHQENPSHIHAGDNRMVAANKAQAEHTDKTSEQLIEMIRETQATPELPVTPVEAILADFVTANGGNLFVIEKENVQ